jgi:hypothetical protein
MDIVIVGSKLDYAIWLIEMANNTDDDYQEWEFQKTLELLRQLDNTRAKGEKIMALARTNNPINRLKWQVSQT